MSAPLPRTIALSEVRAGDRVRVEWSHEDGDRTFATTGTFASIDEDGDPLTAAGAVIGPNYLYQYTDAMVTLLDRPAPPLPTEPGSVIVDATIRGVPGQVAMLRTDGDWATPGLVGDLRWHHPEHITAWTPALVVTDGEPVTP